MSSSQQSVVAQWNEVILESIRAGAAKPTATIDQLFMAHAAIYDAWAAYDATAIGLHSIGDRPLAERTEANAAEAVSHAAFDALSRLFPDRVDRFEAKMAALGLDPAAETAAAAAGRDAAAAVFAARAGDGTNRENGYATPPGHGYAPVNDADPTAASGQGGALFDPNHWTPLRVPTGAQVDANGTPVAVDGDPASYVDQVALTPHWGGVAPFALPSGDAVRPAAPPMLGDLTSYTDAAGKTTTGDAAYREQFAAVLEASRTLTTREKVIAEFWADGPRTESPPGHWNQIAQDVALREGHGIAEDAKMFLALNAAVFDAGVATWEAKYHYDFVRPQSAIRHLYAGEDVEAWAGPGLGTQVIDGGAWRPYQNVTFVTPPFPEFTSGHSSFSAAAAATIAAFVADDTYYDGVSRGNHDLDSVEGPDLLGLFETNELAFETFSPDEDAVSLRWDTLFEAAADAGLSRIYGGIHIQDGDLRGREIGRAVAEIAEAKWRALFGETPDGDLLADAAGGTLYAGLGNDRLTGLGGDDVLKPGVGADTITTGAGADTVWGTLAELDGDTVRDLSSEDRIVLRGETLGASDLRWDGAAGALRIGEATISLEGIGPMARLAVDAVEGGTAITVETPVFGILAGDGRIGRLNGSDAAEIVDAGGGRLDVVRGGGGEDVFVFTDTAGARDGLRVLDFDPHEDALFLRGAAVAAARAFGDTLAIRLDGADGDAVHLHGVADIADVRILAAAEFDALALA